MHAYGPVPSRRLGRSIGVSPIPPKTCSYTCVYCQLGRTTKLTVKRESFYPKEDVLRDIEKIVALNEADYLTFVGDGEPTLSRDLGWLIRECRRRFSLKIAVITNGSLFFDPDVREQVLEADVILPSLDAGSEEAFRRINRPHPSIRFDQMLEGQIMLRESFDGQIWEEVMLVSGLNDSEEALSEIRDCLDRLGADRVYLNVPIRPPAEEWVMPPSPERVLRASEILGNAWDISGYETGEFGLGGFSSAAEAILQLCSRHPMRIDQAEMVERRFGEEGVIESLIRSGELKLITYRGKSYVAPARFRRGGRPS